MRWNNLFDDLEGQLEDERGAEEQDLKAEEERLRLGRLTLRDRLVALERNTARSAGIESDGTQRQAIRLVLLNGKMIAVRSPSFGRDWISADIVAESTRRVHCILPLSAIASLELDRHQIMVSTGEVQSGAAPTELSRRLGLGFVLRDLCRRRSSIEVDLMGATIAGTIDRVGGDHFDLAVHDRGSARRESSVDHYRVVPFSQLLLVRL